MQHVSGPHAPFFGCCNWGKGAMRHGCSVQSVTGSLNSVSSSLSAVPDLTTYIASLTPAVTAYTALGPTIFADMQSQVTSINSSLTSVSTHVLTH